MRKTVSVILMMVVLLTACGDFDQAGSQEVDKGDIVNIQENPKDDLKPLLVDVIRKLARLYQNKLILPKKG